MANQPDTVMVDKLQKRAVVKDEEIPSDRNTKKTEHEKLAKYKGGS